MSTPLCLVTSATACKEVGKVVKKRRRGPSPPRIASESSQVVMVARSAAGLARKVRRPARAALAFLRTRFAADPTHVIVVGHSLGAAVATKLATEQRVRALVLEAPFTTSVAVARYRYGAVIGWAARFILRSPFAPLEDVPHLDVAVSVVVGSRDQTVPPEMSRAVFNAAHRKGVFLEIPGAGHRSFLSRPSEPYWNWFMSAVRN